MITSLLQKVAKSQEVTDYRFFVRAIIRHSDLVTKVRDQYVLKILQIKFLLLNIKETNYEILSSSSCVNHNNDVIIISAGSIF